MNAKDKKDSCTKKNKGILYGEQTTLAVRNMSFSGKIFATFPEYINAGALVKKACALANYNSGDLPLEKMQAIFAACDELRKGGYYDQFPVDVFHGGGGIALNMNMSEVIASLANQILAREKTNFEEADIVRVIDDVNMSQSTADFCHSTLRITLLFMLDGLMQSIRALQKVSCQKADSFANIKTIARTCWQDGMAVNASELFMALDSALERQCQKLEAMQTQLHYINLGGTVIGSGTGASSSYRDKIIDAACDITGLALKRRPNLYDAAQYPDDLAELSALIRRIAAILEKFAQDLRLLSSGPETGLQELRLPAVQAGSSFFPGKINPVIPETMIQCSMLIGGNDAVVQRSLSMGETFLNPWEEMVGFLLIESCRMLERCNNLFLEYCFEGIEINKETCEKYSTSKIPYIVTMKENYGYEYVSKFIKENKI